MGTSWHFWLVACGLALSFSSLLLGGLIQGFALSDPGVTFLTSLELAQPFRLVAAIGSFAFFLGCVIFAVAALKILLRKADVLPPVKNKGATV
jgi:cytochrome c oxidase cbb3-type subunit 1